MYSKSLPIVFVLVNHINIWLEFFHWDDIKMLIYFIGDSARSATAMESITSVPQISGNLIWSVICFVYFFKIKINFYSHCATALADPPVPVSEGEEEIVASSTSGKWATSPLPEVTTPSGKWQVHGPQTEPSTPSSQSRLQSGGILICLTLEPNLFVL